MTEIIAECGINHRGNMNLAKAMIELTRDCGASAAKFQFYVVDKLFPNKEIITQGKNWYDEVKQTELTYNQGLELAEHCKKVGIEFLASAFDEERVGWLEDYGVKRHKIASPLYRSELSDWENEVGPTVMAMCETGKPIIVSVPYGDVRPELPTGAPYYFLYCIPEYPAPLTSLKLSQVDFAKEWDGFSDHTVGIEASVIAMAKGAKIIEKHFTISRALPGPDQVCSMTPDELRALVKLRRVIELCQ